MFCHEALHLKEKLQRSASYMQKVEKWDTDSDSAYSDDEKDLGQPLSDVRQPKLTLPA